MPVNLSICCDRRITETKFPRVHNGKCRLRTHSNYSWSIVADSLPKMALRKVKFSLLNRNTIEIYDFVIIHATRPFIG